MQKVNLRSFKIKVSRNVSTFKRFLTKIEKNPPKKLDDLAIRLDKEVWHEVDCLTCANCCKSMTPTFNAKDIKRISAHLQMTPAAFKEKWLVKDTDNDWTNELRPCQFLDTKTNMCSIYAIRPDDCAGFPHLTKKKMKDYLHVHKQNISYCPATYRMVEKMKAMSDEKLLW
jgi:uncharacterized protein